MAQGRSTEIISMIQWIRTDRLSIKKSLSLRVGGGQDAYLDLARSHQRRVGEILPLTVPQQQKEGSNVSRQRSLLLPGYGSGLTNSQSGFLWCPAHFSRWV